MTRSGFAARRLANGVCALLGAALLAACGDPAVPRIVALRYDGQAKDSPLVVLLSVDFEDADGDLADGTLETFIDQTPTGAGTVPLLPLFLRADLPQDATSGTFGFVLELSFSNGEPPAAGTRFAIGARVTDGSGHASATAETRLQLDP